MLLSKLGYLQASRYSTNTIRRQMSPLCIGFLCVCVCKYGILLATAKEQTKSADKDKRNARAGEKPEQVWGYIATNTQTYIHIRGQSVQTQVNIGLSLVSMAKAISKYTKADK
jgi:hypothetical protein